jgi:hypothetical protein
MPSINNLTPGARSMNGLNTLSANNIDADTLDVDVLIVNSAGTCPTRPPGDDTTNISNTAFVKNAIDDATATLVTLDTTQILTSGTKTFTNLPLCATLATTGNQFTNKSYVDSAISGAGGSFVTLTTAQTVSGNKDFTGTTRLGDALGADQPCRVSITNNTTSDTSVNGTIGGESVYHQVRLGARALYISQGLTDNQNQYFGVSGSGAPDPEFVLTLRNGVGIKISNGLDTSSFTEQLKVVGTSRFTGVGTFEVSPVCAVAPTTANQLIPKNYADNNFCALTGSQIITGNKTIWPTSGSTVIRGSQADIFPDVCFLTGNTTTISGVNCNITSTTNFIAGTTTNIATTTVNVQNTCGNFNVNATNTNLTGTIATATTQVSTDNSTKLATTAFVNSYAMSNFMTLNTNQTIPATTIKTFQGQQIFNAGLTSNNIYASGTTDMTLGSNMGNGILNIDSSKIICDTFGVRMVNLNTQLNEGCFIQPNPSLAVGEAPSINFPNNQSANFANTGNAGEADATRQINVGVLKFWCGCNQSSVFTISHSLTNGYAVGPAAWEEEVITFSFVDANTGITRYTTANLATTGLFSMPPLGTVVRPNISFTLDTTTLPQAVYNIFAYVRIQNASISNVLNTVTWNLSASPSTLTTTQNYNTYKDYTFTSRNLYHCFRNTAMCGVYIINNIATQQNIMTPIHYSITDFTNFTFQGAVAGALTTPAVTGGTVAGSWVGLSINNADNIYLCYPNYSIILYDATGWSGVPILNFKNTGLNPVTVRPTTTQIGSSCRIYFDEIELIKY